MLGYAEEEWTRDRDFFMKILHPDDAGMLIQLGEDGLLPRDSALAALGADSFHTSPRYQGALPGRAGVAAFCFGSGV